METVLTISLSLIVASLIVIVYLLHKILSAVEYIRADVWSVSMKGSTWTYGVTFNDEYGDVGGGVVDEDGVEDAT